MRRPAQPLSPRHERAEKKQTPSAKDSTFKPTFNCRFKAGASGAATNAVQLQALAGDDSGRQ